MLFVRINFFIASWAVALRFLPRRSGSIAIHHRRQLTTSCDLDKLNRDAANAIRQYLNTHPSTLTKESHEFLEGVADELIVAGPRSKEELSVLVGSLSRTVVWSFREITILRNQLSYRLSALESPMKSLQSDQQALESSMKSLQSDHQALESSMKSLQSDQQALESSMKSLQSDQQALESSMKSLQSDQQALESSMKSLQSDQQALAKKFEIQELILSIGQGALDMEERIRMKLFLGKKPKGYKKLTLHALETGPTFLEASESEEIVASGMI